MRKGQPMRAIDRERLQRKLDEEMRPFRRAGMEMNATNGLLRAIRTALRIPVKEIAERMGMHRSGVSDMEARELASSITLRSLSRMAEAMGCKVVYGIVPQNGKKLEEVAEARRWRQAIEEEARAGNERTRGTSERVNKGLMGWGRFAEN